jgi:hypothetical protein
MQNKLARRNWKPIVVVNLWSHFLEEITSQPSLKYSYAIEVAFSLNIVKLLCDYRRGLDW